jgi:hypothetical protein
MQLSAEVSVLLKVFSDVFTLSGKEAENGKI